jgi:hypothetical protein
MNTWRQKCKNASRTTHTQHRSGLAYPRNWSKSVTFRPKARAPIIPVRSLSVVIASPRNRAEHPSSRAGCAGTRVKLIPPSPHPTTRGSGEAALSKSDSLRPRLRAFCKSWLIVSVNRAQDELCFDCIHSVIWCSSPLRRFTYTHLLMV